MARLRGAATLAAGVFRRADEQDLDDELQFHIDKATERNIRRGMSPEEARRVARATFGGQARWAESTRDEHRSRILDEFGRDFRYGVAALRRHPAFAIGSVLTIGLGLAATVTVFSFINSIYLRPLDVPEGSRLVRIYGADRPEFDRQLGYPAYERLRHDTRSFDMVAAHYSTAPLYLSARGNSEEEMGAVVSSDYFRMLGIRPALGRFFLSSEDSVPDRNAVAVIGYDLWQRRFGGDARVIGERIAINERAFTIIGIAPPKFNGVVAGWSNELWIPTMMLHTGYRWCDAFLATCPVTSIIARLARGTSIQQARAEVSAMHTVLLAATDPADSMKTIATTSVVGVPTWQQRDFAQLSGLLSAIALILLGVACANLSGLLLARGLSRHKEMALRTSLGASRGRIARQLLTESLTIAVAGGALGVAISLVASRALAGFFAVDNEGYVHPYAVPLDGRVLAFATGAVLIAVLAFGLLPALVNSRVDLIGALRAGNGGTAPRSRARTILVGGQIALTVALLTGAGMLSRSFSHLMEGRGFDPRNLAQLRLRPLLIGYDAARARPYLYRALESIRAVPGVLSAAPIRGSLVNHQTGSLSVALPGDASSSDKAPRIDFFNVGAGFFATMRIPILAGREFTEHDIPSSPLVAMVSEALAKRLWPEGNAIGKSVILSGKNYEIVGIVQNYRVRPGTDLERAIVYTAFWQYPVAQQIDARVVVRVHDNPSRALIALRRAVTSVDPAVPVTETLAAETQMRATFTEVRLGGAVLIVGSALALFLSAVGLYGVVSFLVARRKKEVGIRLAIGGRPRSVFALLLRQGLRPALAGVAMGVLVSLAGARFLGRWLFDVAPLDPISLTLAVLAVGAVAIVASVVPASSAVRADPIAVLHCD
jgi:predicted permease